MGIQINGQTDTISASDGGLSVSGYELTGASNINVTGIVTATGLDVTNIKHPSFGSNTFVLDSSGNINIDSGGVYYDASNNRLAIGSTSPSAPLEIRSDSAGSVVSLLKLNNNAAIASGKGVRIDFGLSDSSTASARGYIENVVDGSNGTYMAFGVNDGATGTFEAVRIDRNRRLLVGTSTARSNFFNGSYTPRLQLESASNGANSSIALVSAGNGAFNEPNLIFAKSRGSAIGDNTIVQSGDDIGGIQFQASDGAEYIAAASILAEVDGTPGANDMPGRLVFSTTADGASSPTERMRIGNDGGTYFFGNSGKTLIHSSTANAANTSGILFRGRHTATSTQNGTDCIYIYANGNVVNTNNSYGSLSDIKLKENIVDANSQWNDLKALQVRNYNLKEGQTHTQIGLIAQEVELVSPGLVSESPDRDEEGNDLGTVTKSVNYSVLYMKAVKALQEAMERIETLEAKVAALEAS